MNKNIRAIVWRGILVYCLAFWGVVVAVVLHVAGGVNHETNKKNKSERRKNFFRMAC